MNCIYAINGPVVKVRETKSFSMREMVMVGKSKLIGDVIGRLAVVPAIGLTVGILLGFRNVELVTLIAIFASPSAVSSFPMAQQMDSDAELAGDAVVFSSMFSCFTMFLRIFAAKSLGLF